MAIVKMNKLSVIGLEADKAEILRRLQDLGVVEINDPQAKLTDAEWTAIIHKDSDEDQVSALEAELNKVETVLNTVAKYDTEKKPLFASRKPMTKAEDAKVLGSGDSVQQRVNELYERVEQWNEKRSEENVIVSQQASLTPWMSYDLPLELSETREVRVFYGVIPAVADTEALKAKVAEASDATEVSVLGKDAEQQYVSALCMRADEEEVLDALKSFGFTAASFKGMKGTASENMEKLGQRLTQVREEQKALEAQFVLAPEEKAQIQCYYDEQVVLRDRAKICDRLLATKKAFYFDGWVPAEKQSEVIQTLEEYGCWSEVKEPEKGEETPVLMKNNSLIYPVQVITELYSLPKSYEVDPTPIFAAFYIVFFGMMFADIAYGLILAGLCAFALWKYKPEGLAFRLLKTLVYCGISTAIWGVLFGGFFGDMIKIKPLWMNPLENAMFILAFSCILGVVHLFIGMGVKAYMQIRDGHLFDAICDVFIWYVFIIGLALLLFGNSYVAPGSGTIGKYMAIIGAVWIVGCEFIRGKGIGKLVGLWNLYGTTSYLADILSYSRLLALGLASAVIAQVFNMLGRMLGKGVVGVIGFIVIALLLNLNF